jgi:hypothetical protein
MAPFYKELDLETLGHICQPIALALSFANISKPASHQQ